MVFRNYCIVAMGNVTNVKEDVCKISQIEPKYLNTKGVFIGNFTSTMTPGEIKEFLNVGGGRTFIITEISDDVSAFHIDKEEFHVHVFGESSQVNEFAGDTMSGSTNNEVTSVKTQPSTTTLEDVKTYTAKQKRDRIDELLDIGYDKLTAEEKHLLALLTGNA